MTLINMDTKTEYSIVNIFVTGSDSQVGPLKWQVLLQMNLIVKVKSSRMREINI